MQDQYCEICYDNKPKSDFLALSECSHEFCKPCLSEYIQNIYSTREFYSLKCPNLSCTKTDLESIIKEVLSSKDFESFISAKYHFILSLDPRIRWCPTPDCKGYSDATNEKELTCNVCKNKFCRDCSQTWENSHKCPATSDLHKYIKNVGAKVCPGCKNIVEKKSGCNSMNCRCGVVFCMTCGNVITSGHDSLKCLLGLENPSVWIIIGLLLSLILFPFHIGWFLLKSNTFDIKDDEGRSIYNYKNVTGYVFLFLLSPLLTLWLMIVIPGYLITTEFDITKHLPRTRWFWPVKLIILVLVYILTFFILILGYLIYNLYLTTRGVFALFHKIFKK